MGVNYNPRCVQDGLELYLDAANIRSYPASGDTWYDISNQSKNATLLNSPTYSKVSNGAFSFDGTNDRFTFPDLVFNDTTFTAEIWGKLPGPLNSSNRRSLFGGFFDTSYRDYEFTSTTTILARFNIVGTGEAFANFGFNPALQLNTVFQNVFLKKPNNVYEIYFNGNKVNTFTPPFNSSLGSIQSNTQLIHSYKQFGALGSASRMYNGDLYLTRIYSRDLSALEIKQNFDTTKSRFGI